MNISILILYYGGLYHLPPIKMSTFHMIFTQHGLHRKTVWCTVVAAFFLYITNQCVLYPKAWIDTVQYKKEVLYQGVLTSSVLEMVTVDGAVYSVPWKEGVQSLPLAPLAPVLGCEVKAFGVYAEMSLLHGFFVSVHNLLWKCQNVLTLIIVDQIEVL